MLLLSGGDDQDARTDTPRKFETVEFLLGRNFDENGDGKEDKRIQTQGSNAVSETQPREHMS